MPAPRTHNQPQSSKKRRIIGIATIIIVVVAVLFGGYACPFEFVTGIPCPGCGMTRAFLALLRGDFALSWTMHPMLIPALAVMIYLIVVRVRTGKLDWSKNWVYWPVIVACVAMLIVWVLRLTLGWQNGPMQYDEANLLKFLFRF